MLIKGRKTRRWGTKYPNAAEKLVELGMSAFPQPAGRLHRVPTSEDLGRAPDHQETRVEGEGHAALGW
jgi:hypothetical protein